MIINDRIYGKITITNSLIVDLIHSKPMQRLKKINQHGAGQYIITKDVTRFQHSVGAWYLSFRFKRPLAEQVASLLHDIPHTAFSHVIDVVVGDKNHEYHDRFFKKVILDSEIPQILKNHNLSLAKVLDKEHYPLLNNDLPDISVDRWDYFMRDGFSFGIFPKETVVLFLKSIKEKKQKFYFTDPHTASLFAILYMNCSRLLWLDPLSVGSFGLLAKAITIAHRKKFITEEDFFTTDAVLMEKLKKTEDKDILELLSRLKPGTQFHYAPKKDAEFYGFNKPRFVDPWVLQKGKLIHLSDIFSVYKEYFTEFADRYRYIGVKQI